MGGITIYHNPACGTSRNTLAMIRSSGEEPRIVDYLQTPPTREELQGLLQTMGMGVRDILRRKGTPFDELGLANPALSEDAIFSFIERHPILIQRPIVVSPLGVRLCRPSETVLEILPHPLPGPFTKEDGEVVSAAPGRQQDKC